MAALFLGLSISQAATIGTRRRVLIPVYNAPESTATLTNAQMSVSSTPFWINLLDFSRVGPIDLLPGASYTFELDIELNSSYTPQAQGCMSAVVSSDYPSPGKRFLQWNLCSGNGFDTTNGLCFLDSGVSCGTMLSPDTTPPQTTMAVESPYVINSTGTYVVGPQTTFLFESTDTAVADSLTSGVAAIAVGVDASSFTATALPMISSSS